MITEREAGLGTMPPPISGNYDAVADQTGENSLLLYQDVALDPAVPQHFSLFFDYHSYRPMTVPAENTLAVGGPGTPATQQVRVDLMRAGSDPASLAPGDVLETLFASQGHGDPQQQPWTQLTADLSPYAGRTVRIRIAAVDTELVLNVGVDAVSVEPTLLPQVSALPGAPAPSSEFGFGRVLSDSRRGSAKLTLELPGPGLSAPPASLAQGRRWAAGEADGGDQASDPHRHRGGDGEAVAAADRGGPPLSDGEGSLRARVAVTFTATGGEPKTAMRAVVLKLAKPKRR